jgi:hypothetical protein
MKALIFENQIVDIAEKEFDVNESLTWIDCPDDCIAGRWELVDGVPREKEIPPLNYEIKRKREYPVIGEQLDLLWHAIDDGTLDKTSDFYTSLKATKDKYPKP